ncbi:MAG: hypothetical protein IJW00_05705 [Clostridia bacterium]|nr:hypothetical protein [Clostridia bacterium]
MERGMDLDALLMDKVCGGSSGGSSGGSISSIALVDDGEGNFTIVTTGDGTATLAHDDEGNFTLEVN